MISKVRVSWLQTHLEEFVRPVLGFVPSTMGVPLSFTSAEMTVIKNCWKSVKKSAKGKVLFLPGRDVFIFEVLARRENYPTLFQPGCSRMSVGYFKDKIPEDCFVFDTGFMGSIPNKLGVKDFQLVSYAERQSKIQIFPRLTLARSLALNIEKTPKYWKTGRILDESSLAPNQLLLEYSPLDEFAKAAILTQQIFRDSSSSFVNKPKPLGGLTWRTTI